MKIFRLSGKTFDGFYGRLTEAILDSENNPIAYVDPSEGEYEAGVPDVPALLEALNEPRKELAMLRISLARVAQALGHIDPEAQLKVEYLDYGKLYRLASDQDRGWNDLCYWMVERVRDLRQAEDNLNRLHANYPDEFDK